MEATRLTEVDNGPRTRNPPSACWHLLRNLPTNVSPVHDTVTNDRNQIDTKCCVYAARRAWECDRAAYWRELLGSAPADCLAQPSPLGWDPVATCDQGSTVRQIARGVIHHEVTQHTAFSQ
ncbi:MAG: hypothetical protein KDB23_21275 [Planctomycetales bacterium]|nr:hypothetical protein [Planctomycetales bacterium]